MLSLFAIRDWRYADRPAVRRVGSESHLHGPNGAASRHRQRDLCTGCELSKLGRQFTRRQSLTIDGDDSLETLFARDTEQNRSLIYQHPLEKSQVLDHLEASCRIYIEHDPELPNCARSLGLLFLQGGDRRRARQALSLYLEHIPYRDAQAEAALQKAAGPGG